MGVENRPQGIVDANGNFQVAVPRVVRVVGAAAYAAGGIPIDCSSFFSIIFAALFTRAFTTATGASIQSRLAIPNETGTDVYASAKFRAMVYRTASHTHNFDKANTPTGGPSAAPTPGVDGAHTHALTYTVTASSDASLVVFGEIGPENISAVTYEFLVWGVPR